MSTSQISEMEKNWIQRNVKNSPETLKYTIRWATNKNAITFLFRYLCYKLHRIEISWI